MILRWKKIDSIESIRKEEVFDIEPKEDATHLNKVGLPMWEKLEVLFDPDVFSRMTLLEERSKFLLAPMILCNEGFEWRFEVE